MSGENVFVGIVALLGALGLAWRMFGALRTGEVALYRSRLKRDESGSARFYALVGLNALAMFALVAIAADLLLGLGWRP